MHDRCSRLSPAQPERLRSPCRLLLSSNWRTKRLAPTQERKQTRQQFIQELLAALPLHLVTLPVALRVVQIDGENQTKGVRLPLADLLIAVTALELATVWLSAIRPSRFRCSSLKLEQGSISFVRCSNAE